MLPLLRQKVYSVPIGKVKLQAIAKGSWEQYRHYLGSTRNECWVSFFIEARYIYS